MSLVGLLTKLIYQINVTPTPPMTIGGMGRLQRVNADQLRRWATDVVQSWGANSTDSEFLADTLIDANLRGTDSHGVIRVPVYDERVRHGLVSASAVPQTRVLSDSCFHVDGRGAFGQIASRAAVDCLLGAVRDRGVATAVVRRSAHFGTAGYYARMLAREGLVAIVASNSEPIVIPYGGRDALFGTNPIAFAAPGSEHVICLDMATSTTAMGKVMVAQDSGTEIPMNWGVDSSGAATSDPHAVQALQPASGPKGYGIALFIEILAGALSGAAMGPAIGNMYQDFSRPQNVGHWFLAIDPEVFAQITDVRESIRTLVEIVHSSRSADESLRVLLPGEPEELTSQRRLRDGIDLPEAAVDRLTQWSHERGLMFPTMATPTEF